METIQQSDKALRDYQLVLAARDNGDQRAYANLMEFYRMPVYTMLLRMTKNPTEADDLTIEAFCKAFCQLGSFVPTHTFSSWLFSIACNHAIDFIRRKRMATIPLSEVETSVDGEVREYPLPSTDSNPEEAMIGQQRDTLLRDVVKRLPPRYRQIVQLRYFEECSYEEISQQLHMPIGTVKTQLNRARMLLGQILHSNQHLCL